MSPLEALFAELERRGVRYVVVGGLAVVLHGHARLTGEVDRIALKEIAGRDVDRSDFAALREIQRRRETTR